MVESSSSSVGNIFKGPIPFIHNFGSSNTFIGENAGNFTMSGIANTASGVSALSSNTTGNYNTASGSQSLVNNSIGVANTASGYRALNSNTTGNYNTASGYQALSTNTDGIYNTASGFQSLSSNTTGSNNTANGLNALYLNTSGYQNTASGSQALQNNTTGNNNIALGFNAGGNLTTGSFNIDIGNPGVAGESNTIRIGANQTKTFMAGIINFTTPAGVQVIVDANGQLGVISSSRRYKDDIADMDAASMALMKLRPVTFHYKTDHNPSGRTLQYGLIAEEVAEVYPGLVAHSADGHVETVMYQFLPSMLLNEYQKQQRMLAKQALHIATLEQDRQTQNARMDAIERSSAEQATHMAKLLDQLRRTDVVSAGLELK